MRLLLIYYLQYTVKYIKLKFKKMLLQGFVMIWVMVHSVISGKLLFVKQEEVMNGAMKRPASIC